MDCCNLPYDYFGEKHNGAIDIRDYLYSPLIHPCFFANPDAQGFDGVLMWIGILFVVFVAVGYAFFGIDKLEKKNKK